MRVKSNKALRRSARLARRALPLLHWLRCLQSHLSRDDLWIGAAVAAIALRRGGRDSLGYRRRSRARRQAESPTSAVKNCRKSWSLPRRRA